ncbi:MAG TPA: coenzyme F420 hydrogenase [Phycisphaerales bacterium]|nr:coenzyme F420 hydrogenase [Phycisphaerales bacterium]
MRLPVLSIRDVAERHLCTGCGACAYLSPDEIEMVDDLDQGRRPLLRHAAPADPRSEEAARACPGAALEQTAGPSTPGVIHELLPAWGPVLNLWEGHAADPEVRFAGSSGGAASALALFCIERLGMHGLLHIAAREDVPYLNRTVLSRTREEILAATGSRYAPASPCDSLHLVERAPAPCVFIGKPCDVAGAHAAARLRPALERRMGLTIGIFCAGAPSTKGTLEMLKAMGVDDPESLLSVRYRGNGWPGLATARFRARDGSVEERTLTYSQSWGDILQKHRQWRCYICPDHTGEFADIAVGDPWYRPVPDNAAGSSLVLARTERGRRIIEQAIDAGYLLLTRVEPRVLPESQPNLLRTRGAVWGRLLALRLVGAAVPRYSGLAMRPFWLSALSVKEKAQSILGTVRRAFRKGLRRRRAVVPFEAPHHPAHHPPHRPSPASPQVGAGARGV